MTVTIHKLEEHIGADVQGVDITSPINDETFEQLRPALCKYSVLVFHDQAITDEQHVAFSEGFGRLEMTMLNDPIGDGGPIGIISNVDEHGEIIPPEDARMMYTIGNALWHSDGAFKRVPLRGVGLERPGGRVSGRRGIGEHVLDKETLVGWSQMSRSTNGCESGT